MIEMPISLLDVMGEEFNVHLMEMGRSPFTITQVTPVLSRALKESCPNVNGMISGETRSGLDVTRREKEDTDVKIV